MKQLIPKQSAAIMAGLSFLAAFLLAIGFGSVSAPARTASTDVSPPFSDAAVAGPGSAAGLVTDGSDLTVDGGTGQS